MKKFLSTRAPKKVRSALLVALGDVADLTRGGTTSGSENKRRVYASSVTR